MEKNNLNDEILIENFLKGDEYSFRMLFERYYDNVNRIVYSYTKNYDDAKDVTQEIFLKVYESLKSFKKKSKFSTWLYRVSVNMSISFLRKKSKEKNLFSLEEVGDLEEKFEEDKPSYDRNLAEKILFELPEKQRLAFILSQKEGKRYKEIAEILNVSEKAVEALVYRARENIKILLEKNKSM